MKIVEKQYFGTSWENVHFLSLVVFESKEINNQEIKENVKWYLFIEHKFIEAQHVPDINILCFEWNLDK